MMGAFATGGKLDNLFSKIGVRNKPAEAEEAVEDEYFEEFPEMEPFVMTFGELLKKAGYDEEVQEQYSIVADIEVRSPVLLF